MFLYSDTGLNDDAYFITPSRGDSDEGDIIHHQYGCVCCDQFEVRGKLEIVRGEVAETIRELLGQCNYADAAVLTLKTGLEFDHVLGEGLAVLKDGRYVATHNCD